MAVVEYRGGFIFAVVLLGVMCALGGCAATPQGEERGVVAVEKDGRADGYVVRVNERAGEVYINLGKADRIVPGMSFTCFDGRVDMGVRLVGNVEVVEVGDSVSLCRITHVEANRTIHGGDKLVNYMYHAYKDRKEHVVIAGEFDLDGDGVATMAEGERMAMLIKQWGAVIEPGVTVHTDYLVLGKRPASPSMKDPAPVPVKGDVVDHRTLEQKEYDRLLEEAKRLGIPVLNQNRGLDIMDYQKAGWAQR